MFAVFALTTRDLERGYDPVADFYISHPRSDLVDNAHKFCVPTLASFTGNRAVWMRILK